MNPSFAGEPGDEDPLRIRIVGSLHVLDRIEGQPGSMEEITAVPGVVGGDPDQASLVVSRRGGRSWARPVAGRSAFRAAPIGKTDVGGTEGGRDSPDGSGVQPRVVREV